MINKLRGSKRGRKNKGKYVDRKTVTHKTINTIEYLMSAAENII